MVVKDLEGLTTAHLADACLQLGIDPRLAPQDLVPIGPGVRISGRALPVRHSGSVDIFIEAISQGERGSVLVIDDNGRRDQACIGDLVVGEAKLAGIAGILVWGCHRDTREIRELGLPVFSLGVFPSGPRTASERDPDALTSARMGGFMVAEGDAVVADDDGAIFVSANQVSEIAAAARTIREREHHQADRLAAGTTLFQQLRFAEYLDRHAADPSYTLRLHLQAIGRAIET
ncbi:MAG: RraA family protein [Actinomycetota bacterium]